MDEKRVEFSRFTSLAAEEKLVEQKASWKFNQIGEK